MSRNLQLTPHNPYRPNSIRKIHIQNLTDLLHVCLLKGDIVRAKRAWAILIRCREVNWKSRWQWGLAILNSELELELENEQQSQNSIRGLISTQTQSQTQTQTQSSVYPGREIEKWLTGLRISAKEEDKPSLLHAVILHLIKWERYRQALDELETYLSSYPYLLSAPLHTYAGLLSFYLAQPPSAQRQQRNQSKKTAVDSHAGSSSPSSNSRAGSVSSYDTLTSGVRVKDSPNPILIRAARAYFMKALDIDDGDEVASEFIGIIDNPEKNEQSEDEENFVQRRDDSEKDDYFEFNDEDDVSEVEDGDGVAGVGEENEHDEEGSDERTNGRFYRDSKQGPLRNDISSDEDLRKRSVLPSSQYRGGDDELDSDDD